MMDNKAVHTKPPIARFANGERFSGGSVTAAVMAKIQIDKRSGAVVFPNAVEIGPALCLEAFRSMPCHATSRTYCGAPGYVHNHFDAGVFRDAPWIGIASFYQEILLSVSLAVNLYPPGTTDWSNYSLDMEANAKQIHDAIISDIFGDGAVKDCLDLAPSLTANQAVLAFPVTWKFDNFTIRSDHDFRGGGTKVTIFYGDRRDQASIAYHAGTTMKP